MSFCHQCPDHEACAQGYPCAVVQAQEMIRSRTQADTEFRCYWLGEGTVIGKCAQCSSQGTRGPAFEPPEPQLRRPVNSLVWAYVAIVASLNSLIAEESRWIALPVIVYALWAVFRNEYLPQIRSQGTRSRAGLRLIQERELENPFPESKSTMCGLPLIGAWDRLREVTHRREEVTCQRCSHGVEERCRWMNEQWASKHLWDEVLTRNGITPRHPETAEGRLIEGMLAITLQYLEDRSGT